ncbi:hypothetical protein VTK56DRAFT_5318 [Thermocarpiscus australiensis]
MRILKTAVLLLTGCLSTALCGKVLHDGRFRPDHVLRVNVAKVSSGCRIREEVVVNGTSPGPLIRLRAGTTSWIRVYNDMEDRNLTMHWHGLAQRMAPFADGSPQVSQWPIPPGHFFDYEVHTKVEDSGTYFYHSHVKLQALSCFGPLIVDHCGSPPFKYDDERILHFQDTFDKTDRDILNDLNAVPFVWSGESRGVLLNGKGVAVGHTAVDGPRGGARGYFGTTQGLPNGVDSDDSFDGSDEIQLAASRDCTLPVIDVEPGKTYRFRFIGATGLSYLTIGLEGHDNLTIIQVDGAEYNVPVTTDHIQIGGGQRFDILFKAKTADELKANKNKTTYFLQFETRDRADLIRGYGVVRYDPNVKVPRAPSKPVLKLPTDVSNWLEYTFQPLVPEKNRAPSTDEVTRRIIIDCEQKVDNESGRVIWEIGHQSWKDSAYQRPLLIDIYQRGEAAIPDYDAAMNNNGWGWDPATLAFPAKVGEVLEIVLQNTGSQLSAVEGLLETHPFHAHGGHYYDIGSGPGRYDPDANNAKLEKLGFRPVKRDTTMLFRHKGQVSPGQVEGWRAWRMRMENPGVWMIHCHILAHAMMGMQSIWVVGSAEEIQKIPPNLSQDYFEYGGSVYGNATHSPSVYEYFGDADECGSGWSG